MHFCPTTVVDNFWDDPNELVLVANMLSYEPDRQGKWPGVRSQPLHLLFPPLFNRIGTKILSCFFDTQEPDFRWQCEMTFQQCDQSTGGGWIHSDDNVGLLTAIIYLSHMGGVGGGTAFYTAKDPNWQFTHIEEKEKGYQGVKTLEEVEEFKLANNQKFEETMVVHSKFNRLVVFDSQLLHGSSPWTGENKRLTLVSFFKYVKTTQPSPLHRVSQAL